MVRTEIRSLRPSRLEMSRLTMALLISLLLHLGTWGGYQFGKKLGWWQRLHAPAWVQKLEKKITPVPVAKKDNEPPVVFVDVSHAEPEPPKKTKYYSNKNSQAANPDASKDTGQPKLDGKQKDVPKTEDVPTLPKLQPTAPPQQPAPETKPAEETHPHDPMSLGDLKLSKPVEPKTADQKSDQPVQRPRTLKEAQAQQQQQLPGQKLQQEGGVRRQRIWSSLDAKATAFGDYDRAIVDAVTTRWYDLLDSRRFAMDRTGKVIVHFKLKFNGSVEELQIQQNTVGELLGYVCEESVQEAAPFGKWPSDMRREIGANYRDISFTFYYY
ncbi:MAG: hypothetical protein P4N60_10015 [Verrucomicrobiae bacterium]|nr:hypothetical protein [Verrucomicrobiae bacterium]